jgi:uncharacterized membrane protein
MDSIIQGKVTEKNRAVKRFGYILSLIFIIIANIGLVLNWRFTGWLYLITMYVLTGSLWAPKLIFPFFWIYRRIKGGEQPSK